MSLNEVIVNNRQNVKAIVLKLFVRYGKESNIERMNIYVDDLINTGYSDVEINSLVDKSILTACYLPTIADILNPVDGTLKKHENKKLSYLDIKNNVGKCSFNLCWGDGFLTIEKPNGLEYLYRCSCKIGQEKEHDLKATKQDGSTYIYGVMPTWNKHMEKSHGYKLINAYEDFI